MSIDRGGGVGDKINGIGERYIYLPCPKKKFKEENDEQNCQVGN